MFEVKGDKAQWRVVYEALAGMSIGEVIKDADLAALLPDTAEGSVKSALYRAIKEMEIEHQRSFARVRLVGYRMVHAREHEGLAREHHRKARRRLATAQRKAHSADRSLLTREERERIDKLELNLAQQRDMVKRLDRGLQVERQERKAETADLAERVDALTQLLARHGIGEAPKFQAAA